MFIIEEIKAAHSKVRSGADFPAYIKEIKVLGVARYESFVSDGHVDYYDVNENAAKAPAKYAALIIADLPDADQFKADLQAHQQGKTDYPTFCKDCAVSGIEKWVVDLEKMTCIYYDKGSKEVLIEAIPL